MGASKHEKITIPQRVLHIFHISQAHFALRNSHASRQTFCSRKLSVQVPRSAVLAVFLFNKSDIYLVKNLFVGQTNRKRANLKNNSLGRT